VLGSRPLASGLAAQYGLVWVTGAASRPALSQRSVCTTITVRPTCSGRLAAVTDPSRTPRMNEVADVIVAVRAPGGRFR
jgi:hypothetical protein